MSGQLAQLVQVIGFRLRGIYRLQPLRCGLQVIAGLAEAHAGLEPWRPVVGLHKLAEVAGRVGDLGECLAGLALALHGLWLAVVAEGHDANRSAVLAVAAARFATACW